MGEKTGACRGCDGSPARCAAHEDVLTLLLASDVVRLNAAIAIPILCPIVA